MDSVSAGVGILRFLQRTLVVAAVPVAFEVLLKVSVDEEVLLPSSDDEAVKKDEP